MSVVDGVSLREAIRRFERAEILDALERTGWVKARAARRLGITERMIGYRIKKYGITKEVKKQSEETRQEERGG
jgi:transcriptional regulator with GAF, ATPase, and Fis domain